MRKLIATIILIITAPIWIWVVIGVGVGMTLWWSINTLKEREQHIRYIKKLMGRNGH